MMFPLDLIPQNDIVAVIITTEIMIGIIMIKTTTRTTTKITTTGTMTKINGERPEVIEIDVTDTSENAGNGLGCRVR